MRYILKVVDKPKYVKDYIEDFEVINGKIVEDRIVLTTNIKDARFFNLLEMEEMHISELPYLLTPVKVL